MLQFASWKLSSFVCFFSPWCKHRRLFGPHQFYPQHLAPMVQMVIVQVAVLLYYWSFRLRIEKKETNMIKKSITHLEQSMWNTTEAGLPRARQPSVNVKSLHARYSPCLLISIWILCLLIILVHYQLHNLPLHRLGDPLWIPLPCKIAERGGWWIVCNQCTAALKHCIRSQLKLQCFTNQQGKNVYNYNARMMSFSLILVFSLPTPLSLSTHSVLLI